MVRVENVERPVLLESVVVRRVEEVEVVLEQLTNHLIVIVVFNHLFKYYMKDHSDHNLWTLVHARNPLVDWKWGAGKDKFRI